MTSPDPVRSCSADEQQKWEHRNLLNCKIAMLAFEQWNYNYTFAYGAHPPKAPMAAAPLSKRELWLRKLLKSGASASQEADKATPLHWAIMGASQPDATEERIVTMLLKAGAKVDVPVSGCGAIGCKCTIGSSTPLHWVRFARACYRLLV